MSTGPTSSPDPPRCPQFPTVSSPPQAPMFVSYYTPQISKQAPLSSDSPIPSKPSSPFLSYRPPPNPNLLFLPKSKQEEKKQRQHSRSIRLKSISHTGQADTAVEAVEEQILPPLLLVLLARSDPPQPAAGRVVVGAVVVAAAAAGGAGLSGGEGPYWDCCRWAWKRRGELGAEGKGGEPFGQHRVFIFVLSCLVDGRGWGKECVVGRWEGFLSMEAWEVSAGYLGW